MQRIQFYHHLSTQPIFCTNCKKQSPYYLHLLINQKPHCYQCIKNNQNLLKSISKPYKQYFQSLFHHVPLPDVDFALQCITSLQQMKINALNILKQLKDNIQKFQLDILKFYTQSKLICQNYIQKIKSLSEKKFDQILTMQASQSSQSPFINQSKYIHTIKSKYQISVKIKQTLEQLKITIPSLKDIHYHYQNQVKRNTICQVPIHSAICVRGKLYFGTADGRIIFQDSSNSNKFIEIKAHQSLIRSLVSDGQYLMYSGSDDFKIKAWDIRKKNQFKFVAEFGIVSNAKSYHRDIIVFNNGKTMASTRGQFDGFKIRLWQLKNYKNIKELSGHENYIRGMALNRKQELITVSDDRTLKVWNSASGECSRIFYHSKKLHNVHVNKSQDFICVYDEENRVMILDDSKLFLIQCWPIGKKVLCSQGKNKLYFGIATQIVVYSWYGIKLHSHQLDANFLPGTLLEVEQKLIACDGKGKSLQIPFTEEQKCSNKTT